MDRKRRFDPAAMKERTLRTNDPYKPKGAAEGRVICPQCHAVYADKHWTLDAAVYEQTQQMAQVSESHCPACLRIRDNYPGGIVLLRGGFLENHRQEILNLLHNEEERAKGINPLERIIAINDGGVQIEVTTTNEKLAQRIGKALSRAYQGEVEYLWSRDDKLVRVNWRRD